METKKCGLCKKVKSTSEFRKQFHKKVDGTGKYYIHCYCRKCDVIRAKEYRDSHPGWYAKHRSKSHKTWRNKLVGDKCLICGETRVLDIAHIVPRKGKNHLSRKGWWNEKWNVIGLCPNHHRLFDKNKLTKDEFEKIKGKVEKGKKKHEQM